MVAGKTPSRKRGERRAPEDSDYVEILNALSQVETVAIYNNGTRDNGAPELGVGGSAFYGLRSGGTAISLTVPEPSIVGLIGVGMFAWAACRGRRQTG